MRYKICNNLFFFLLVSNFFGCNPVKEKEPVVERIRFELFAEVPDVGMPIDMLVKGDTILISDYYGDSLLHQFHTYDGRKLDSKVPRGGGPGELIPPIGTIIYGDTLLAYSRPIMTLFKGSMVTKERLRRIGMAPSMTSNIYASGNGDIISSVMAFSVEDKNKNYRYAALDDSMNVRYMFGEYPSHGSRDEISGIEARSHFHQTLTILPVDKESFVAVGGYDLSFYVIGDDGKYELKKIVIVSPYDYGVALGSEIRSATTRLKPEYERPISYAALDGRKIILARKKEKSPSKNPAIYFEVYDMDGMLESRLYPDKNIQEPFGITKGGEIIAFTEDENGFTLMKSKLPNH